MPSPTRSRGGRPRRRLGAPPRPGRGRRTARRRTSRRIARRGVRCRSRPAAACPTRTPGIWAVAGSRRRSSGRGGSRFVDGTCARRSSSGSGSPRRRRGRGGTARTRGGSGGRSPARRDRSTRGGSRRSASRKEPVRDRLPSPSRRGGRRPRRRRAGARPASPGSATTRQAALARSTLELHRGRRGPEDDRRALLARPDASDVARVVPRRLGLLVRGVVRLVDDEEPEVRKRREHGRAGAHDGVHVATSRPLPLGGALAVREAAVEQRNAVPEPRDEAADESRSEGDLGDEKNATPSGRDRPFQRREIDLGLAAARDAVEEELAVAAGFDRRGDRRDRISPGRASGRGGGPRRPPRRAARGRRGVPSRRPRRVPPSRGPRGPREFHRRRAAPRATPADRGRGGARAGPAASAPGRTRGGLRPRAAPRTRDPKGPRRHGDARSGCGRARRRRAP